MELRQLRHFLAAVDHGNLVRAARVVHISQPALTKSIQNLEAELGVPLLERHARGVAPTVYGRMLAEHARVVGEQTARAAEAVFALRDGRAGRLRLGLAIAAIEFLPGIVAGLLGTMGGLSIELSEGGYEELTSLVREGALDATVCGFPPLGRAEGLVHEPLVRNEFLLVCRTGHRLADAKDASVAELASTSWVLANQPQAIASGVELVFRRGGFDPPRPRMTSNSMTFLKEVVAESDSITFLPRSVVAKDITEGRLAPVGASAFRSTRTVEGIVHRADAIPPPALPALIAAIREEAERRGVGVEPTDVVAAGSGPRWPFLPGT